MFEFKFPDIGEGLIEGQLVKWTVAVGDAIKKDQTVAQVGTDKAVVDLPCPVGGKIAKLFYNAGDMMPVGKVILHVDDATTTNTTSNANNGAATLPQQPTSVTLKSQSLSQEPAPKAVTPVSITTPTLLATPQVRVFAAQHHVDLATIKPTGLHGEITMQDIMSGATKQIQTHVEAQAQPTGHAHDILATPSVRKLARELNVDLNTVVGTGEVGHITADDVRTAASTPKVSVSTVPNKTVDAKPINPSITPQASQSPQTSRSAPQLQQPQLSGVAAQTAAGPVEIVPLTRTRQIIAQHMIQSRHTVAHVTMNDDANVTKLVAIREKYKDAAAKQNIKLTYLPFVVKALTAALKKHPIFNATLDDEKQQIILKKYYNIGFAADTPEGLYVPVIADADKLSIYEIAQRVADLAQKAKDKKLSVREMTNGTCTISSVGALGVEAFTPIINYPEVAILGIGRIEDRAVVLAGEIKVQKMVTLSLSFDHRVADGADAARFMQTLLSYLQDPELLLMEVA